MYIRQEAVPASVSVTPLFPISHQLHRAYLGPTRDDEVFLI